MDRPITETTVTIRGTAYQIRGDADPVHLNSLAAHVDERMHALEASGGVQSPAKLAILASLTIADEFFRERERADMEIEQVRSQARRLEVLLDETLRDG